MNIELGLNSVTNHTAYHIYVENRFYKLDVGETYDTKNLPERILLCGHKKCMETLAESIRSATNPRLPSRLHCLYVCDESSVRYWYNYFQKRNQRWTRPIIYELQLTGQLFGTYAEYLEIPYYWEPTAEFNPSHKEGLFEGLYKVIRECDIAEFPA